ncbi:MAG: DUF763 domain-containing protein [Candidatus Thorarchaeota archaeon]|nr:DUF763 domain-containing protein [Candidatus Thorarchaeota archaeon]
MERSYVKRAGIADLKLHPGKAPHWLVKRMMPMASAICEFIVDEYGTLELLRRLSDPVYFQALSNVLGYDWDSSGSTTVTCGVLKSVLGFEQHQMIAVGGKGMAALKTPEKLRALDDYGMDGAALGHISRMVAKVDNAAVQDGYQLYQHVFFVDDKQNWAVVQQGMDSRTSDARRYHWISESVDSFVEEPHSGMISGRVSNDTLDMTAQGSQECRSTSVDLVKEEPVRLKRLFEDLRPYGESTLIPWVEPSRKVILLPSYKVLPKRIDWAAVRRAYETQPSNYEELLGVNGIGPAAVRGLALVAEMIFGAETSWSDPVRMTFAFGGKDGVPFPVPRKEYDEAIQFMEQTLSEAKMGRRDRVVALQRLKRFSPPVLREM